MISPSPAPASTLVSLDGTSRVSRHALPLRRHRLVPGLPLHGHPLRRSWRDSQRQPRLSAHLASFTRRADRAAAPPPRVYVPASSRSHAAMDTAHPTSVHGDERQCVFSTARSTDGTPEFHPQRPGVGPAACRSPGVILARVRSHRNRTTFSRRLRRGARHADLRSRARVANPGRGRDSEPRLDPTSASRVPGDRPRRRVALAASCLRKIASP